MVNFLMIGSGNFTKNDLRQYFDNEINSTDYFHKIGLFVRNNKICSKEEIKYLKEVLK